MFLVKFTTLLWSCIFGFVVLVSASSDAHFTTNWFSRNTKDWDAYKGEFINKPHKRCLEIGSWEGRSSLYIITNYCQWGW